MLKGLGDLKNILGQAHNMQKYMKEFQKQSGNIRATATVGAGMVTVTASGDQKIVDISINRDLFDPRDVDMLEELVISGVNEALDKVKELLSQEMKNYARKLNIPDLEKHIDDTLGMK